jgi:hypothetical protein
MTHLTIWKATFCDTIRATRPHLVFILQQTLGNKHSPKLSNTHTYQTFLFHGYRFQTTSYNLAAYLQFLDYLGTLDDVYIVSMGKVCRHLSLLDKTNN